MKKLLLIAILATSFGALAREVESYEASGYLDYEKTDSQICNSLVKVAQKSFTFSSDKISKFGACTCSKVGDVGGKLLGNQCRLTYFYETDAPKGDGKPVVKNIVIPKF